MGFDTSMQKVLLICHKTITFFVLIINTKENGKFSKGLVLALKVELSCHPKYKIQSLTAI